MASFWTIKKEKKGRLEGRKLTALEQSFIKKLRIEHPEKVRILLVDQILHPLSIVFRWLSYFTNKVASTPIGITLGYAIFTDRNYKNNLNLILHELVHVRQYESHGGHIRFLQEYIYQCLKFGYKNCPLEKEAENISNALLRENDV